MKYYIIAVDDDVPIEEYQLSRQDREGGAGWICCALIGAEAVQIQSKDWVYSDKDKVHNGKTVALWATGPIRRIL